MAVTAEQIARKLGISNATVSRVLNNRDNVSAKTRKAVLAAIRESGERPRILGPRDRGSRRAGASGTSGVVHILNAVRYPLIAIPEDPYGQQPDESVRLPVTQYFSRETRLTTSVSRHIMDGVIEEASLVGLRTVVQVVEDLTSPRLADQINSSGADGLFLLGIPRDDVNQFLERCRCPVVSFMTWDNRGWTDYVGIDNYLGIRLAFEHLHKLGHRRIGYVAGDLENSMVFRERLAAVKACVVDAGLPLRQDWVVDGSCLIDKMESGVEKVLASDDRPTAMLCCFDGAAVAIQRVAAKLGLKIPEQLSVVGFDDAEIAPLFSPPLTTIRVPRLLMGRQAVQLMMMRLQRPIQPGEGCSLRVTPELIERESTAPPKK